MPRTIPAKRSTIRGWLYNLRKSGKIVFPIVRDGTGLMQCVAVKSNVSEQVFESLKSLTQESSLSVTGVVRAEPRAPGGFELDVSDVHVYQRVSEEHPYPITPKEHGVDFLMDHRHLWLRSRRQHAAIGIRHEVIKGIRDYFDSHGFTLVDTPIFTPAACEGTTTLFEVNYFEDEKVYLTQSGQLYNEANAMAFGKVYCFGPTFRAEKSKTRRHLTEFWMVEPEMAYADLEDVKRVAEELIVFTAGRVLENRREELKALERDISKLEAIQSPFPRMSYDQAVEDSSGQGQRNSMGRRLRQHRRDAAYAGSRPAGNRGSLSIGDQGILFPARRAAAGGRAGSGHHRARKAMAKSSEAASASTIWRCSRSGSPSISLPREAFEWYLDLRRFGTVPHAGFGMGVERFVAWMCGLEHVRETIAYPRMLYRTRP